MPKGKRTRYFMHRNGFKDGTAYVRYDGTSCSLVVVQRATRELRSDLQRVAAGHWRELTAGQAAAVLQRKPSDWTWFDVGNESPLAADAVDPHARSTGKPSTRVKSSSDLQPPEATE